MVEIQQNANILIFEGAQGSGKTSATEHLATKGYKKVRGIPTGPELIRNSEAQNWKQSCVILSTTAENGNLSALDRSVVSLMAFNIRKKQQSEDLIYNLGVSMLRRTIDGKSYNIVSINADPEECLKREDKTSVVAIDSVEESRKEVETYAKLMNRLKNDGFNVVNINNIGISKEEFLETVIGLLARQ